MVSTSNRKAAFALIIISLLFLTNGIFVLHDLSIYTPDSARYMVWAQSLASFHGFKDATGPEAQQYVIHAPLYALLLTPAALFFPGDLIATKGWTMMFGLAAIILFWYWVRKTSTSRAGLIAAFLFATNALVLLYSTEVLSDIPFAIVLMIFFLLNDSLEAERSTGKMIGLALVVAAGMLVREVGVALLASQLIYAVFRKDYKRGLIVFEIAAVVFLFWLVRNEWLVAVREQPFLTNGKLFSHHFFTPASGSLAGELIARFVTNSRLYAGTVGGLLFYPTFGGLSYDVVYRYSGSVNFWNPIIHAISIPVALITVGGVGFGAWIDQANSRTAGLKLIFLALYGLIVLCYPINDIRFLMPALTLGIYYFATALDDVIGRLQGGKPQAWPKFVLVAVLIILALPNTVWTRQYVSANRSYDAFFAGETGADTLKAGSVFSKPIGKAAEWIVTHTPSTTIVLSQSKDLAYMIGTRKLINVNETLTLDNFEYYLRDYDVKYLVAATGTLSIPEFAFQMYQSRRFVFTPAYQAGNLVVYQIDRRRNHPVGTGELSEFRKGLALLGDGKNTDSRVVFEKLRRADSLNFPALFFAGVAAEFSDSMAQAENLFARFMVLPQSGMYLDRSATHREIIRALSSINEFTPPPVRAEQLASIGASYWEMGFHNQARTMLHQAVGFDSSCYSASLFDMYFALEDGDTSASWTAFKRMKELNPGAKAIIPMGTVFASLDSIKSGGEQGHLLMNIAGAFVDAGLIEDAIETYRNAISIPTLSGELRANADSRLADLYITKRRFAPAMELLHRLKDDPAATGIPQIQERIDALAIYF